MLPQGARLHDIGLQNISLANFERSMGVQHRQWWQAPQQSQQSSRDTPNPDIRSKHQPEIGSAIDGGKPA
jgi:hypothetical protein